MIAPHDNLAAMAANGPIRLKTPAPAVPGEADPDVWAWRAGAMNLVLVVIAAAGLPLTVSGLLGKPFLFPRDQIWIGVAAYAAVIVAILVPRRRHVWRATILFCSLYVLSIERMATNGLAGDGRIALFAIPLLAVLLLGTRAGWIAAFVSVAVMAGFAMLARAGLSGLGENVGGHRISPGYWLFQTLQFLAALLPLMVLFVRFLNMQARTMSAERLARLELEEESARRRRLESEIIRVSEEERRRVGSELHDGLCQHLTAALLHCSAVENRLAGGNMPEAAAAGRLRTMLEDSIGMAYDASKGLCPLDLNPESLAFALERLARQTQQAAGIACEFLDRAGGAACDPQQALHLFRIAQEAVKNAVRHARCRNIRIGLADGSGALTLMVEDDGVGRRPEAGPQSGGMGTQLMAFRAEAIGGTLTIEDRASGGTVVTCRVPARDPEAASE